MEQFNGLLSPGIRRFVEDNYYQKICDRSKLEIFARDPDFLAAPTRHVALFSDHGVVHVRDVAEQILRVLSTAHGVLIPERTSSRFEFMRGYGFGVAYLHDIGMRDFSAFGRAMHPEFAAQEVFREEFDALIEEILNDNVGNLPWRLFNLIMEEEISGEPRVLLRECLALSICHSKSKIPVEVLNDPRRLRDAMLTSVGTPLRLQFLRQQLTRAKKRTASGRSKEVSRIQQEIKEHLDSPSATEDPDHEIQRHYEDFPDEAFRWLTAEG